jgi:hypothetical protein
MFHLDFFAEVLLSECSFGRFYDKSHTFGFATDTRRLQWGVSAVYAVLVEPRHLHALQIRTSCRLICEVDLRKNILLYIPNYSTLISFTAARCTRSTETT